MRRSKAVLEENHDTLAGSIVHIDACVRNRCVYFAAVGGIAALLAKHVTESETVAWDDLRTEALRRIELIDFPVFVAVDSQGGDLYRAIEAGEQL